MEPPEAGEKFGYKVIMEDGHVVDFLHKSKRRKHLITLTPQGWGIEHDKKQKFEANSSFKLVTIVF